MGGKGSRIRRKLVRQGKLKPKSKPVVKAGIEEDRPDYMLPENVKLEDMTAEELQVEVDRIFKQKILLGGAGRKTINK